MRNITKILLCIPCILFLSACSSNTDFEQIEYYKNEAKWRVFVYVAPNATIDQIKEHARKQMYTPGKTTDVYYYRSNPYVTPFAVTNASSALEAQKFATRPGCVLRYQKSPNGVEYFSETPYEDWQNATQE